MSRDRGSAAVEFVAIVPLLLLVGLSVLQLALLAHARAIVGEAAGEAARAAAVSADPGRAAHDTAVRVVGHAMGDVPLTGMELRRDVVSGLPVVTVHLEARPALSVLPDVVTVSGTGRALLEGAGP